MGSGNSNSFSRVRLKFQSFTVDPVALTIVLIVLSIPMEFEDPSLSKAYSLIVRYNPPCFHPQTSASPLSNIIRIRFLSNKIMELSSRFRLTVRRVSNFDEVNFVIFNIPDLHTVNRLFFISVSTSTISRCKLSRPHSKFMLSTSVNTIVPRPTESTKKSSEFTCKSTPGFSWSLRHGVKLINFIV